MKNAVVGCLRRNGFGRPRVASLHQHGPDIIAPTPNRRRELWIEAKGETSSDPGSNNYDNPFRSNQREDHLGKALLKCAQWTSANRKVCAGIAFPADEGHVQLISGIMPTLKKLRYTVFVVKQNGRVLTPLGLPQ